MHRANTLGCADDQHIRPPDKETCFDDARDQIERRFEFAWLGDPIEMDIDNEVAGFGEKWTSVPLAQDNSALGERFDLSCGTSPPEGNDFDWQGKRPTQDWDLFCVVHDYDELFG